MTRASESREGIDCTPEQMQKAAELLKPLLAKQGLNHIYATHAKDLPFSIRSCYRHIHNNNISITLMELPAAVKYKPRHKDSNRRDNLSAETLEGRRYEDFMALGDKDREQVVEMDCVEGPSDSDVAVLTLHFKALHFQIGIRLAKKDTEHVIAALNWIDDICEGRFTELFGLILCDRGTEFADVIGMEQRNGVQRCSVYYCDARQSQQKGSCEKNHEEFRKICPKGTSFDNIGAWELAEVFSHVNSERRNSIFGKCPYELAHALFPQDLLDNLGYHLVEADEVTLKPKLLEIIRQQQDEDGSYNQ
jgi:IS30 family transposase